MIIDNPYVYVLHTYDRIHVKKQKVLGKTFLNGYFIIELENYGICYFKKDHYCEKDCYTRVFLSLKSLVQFAQGKYNVDLSLMVKSWLEQEIELKKALGKMEQGPFKETTERLLRC